MTLGFFQLIFIISQVKLICSLNHSLIESTLIPQYYHHHNTSDDLLKNNPTEMNVFCSARKLEARDILEFEQLFIIAEPRYGETTLITQLLEIFEKEKIPFYYENGIRNDLKKTKCRRIAGISYLMRWCIN